MGWDTWADFKRTSSGQVLPWVLCSHETSITNPSLLSFVWTYPQLCHCLLIQWDVHFRWKAVQQLTARWEIRWHGTEVRFWVSIVEQVCSKGRAEFGQKQKRTARPSVVHLAGKLNVAAVGLSHQRVYLDIGNLLVLSVREADFLLFVRVVERRPH